MEGDEADGEKTHGGDTNADRRGIKAKTFSMFHSLTVLSQNVPISNE